MNHGRLPPSFGLSRMERDMILINMLMRADRKNYIHIVEVFARLIK
jgi:hypothetical protein